MGSTQKGDPVVVLKIDTDLKEYGYMYDTTREEGDTFLQNSESLNNLVKKIVAVPPDHRPGALVYHSDRSIGLAYELFEIIKSCKRAFDFEYIPKGDEEFYDNAFDPKGIKITLDRLFETNKTLHPVMSEDKTEFTYKKRG
ncbi:MAG: hypothetical protein QE263_06825 [Vampirovibrionales bacterium]|nr:hypothetical protein [Vampirovibrionales bacterium]